MPSSTPAPKPDKKTPTAPVPTPASKTNAPVIVDQPKGVAAPPDVPPAEIAPEPPMVAQPAGTDLAKLLVEARALHTVYRTSARRIVAGQVVHDPTTEMAALERVTMLRETADAMDPDHSDPAWDEDRAFGFNHVELLKYYRQVRERRLR